jgi:hypothetical protein
MQTSVRLDSETWIWVCQELNELRDSVWEGNPQWDFMGEKDGNAYADKLGGISSAIEQQVLQQMTGSRQKVP